MHCVNASKPVCAVTSRGSVNVNSGSITCACVDKQCKVSQSHAMDGARNERDSQKKDKDKDKDKDDAPQRMVT